MMAPTKRASQVQPPYQSVEQQPTNPHSAHALLPTNHPTIQQKHTYTYYVTYLPQARDALLGGDLHERLGRAPVQELLPGLRCRLERKVCVCLVGCVRVCCGRVGKEGPRSKRAGGVWPTDGTLNHPFLHTWVCIRVLAVSKGRDARE